MDPFKHNLVLDQLDRRLLALTVSNIENATHAPEGWIVTMRNALNISLRQVAAKLGITAQGVKKLEKNEVDGSITLKRLRESAEALDMTLVYAFLPKDGSLEKLIKRKAIQKAKEIVERTSHSMSLEDQRNSEERLKKAIQEKAETLAKELPKYLWD